MLGNKAESIAADTTKIRKKDRTNPDYLGIRIERHFSVGGEDPLEAVEWEIRDARITDVSGEDVFAQCGVEVPKSWSQLATNVVVQKYFRGTLGTPGRETSVRQLVSRVAKTITKWGKEQKYFTSADDAQAFSDELTTLLVTQRLSFNSPVWFNVGVEESPQCSACFINSVEDTMESILSLTKTEGMLFKWGSGTGTNFSSLRSSKEKLAGGGLASGPVSFMRGFDAFAGVIKSGGKTRRAAKMVVLNADHPDIMSFIWCKAAEEKKAWSLIDAGYDGSFNGEAYDSIFFQNSNNSVRATNEFMEAVVSDRDWQLRAITTGDVLETVSARKLMRAIAEAAHQCGDPGMQFHTTVNSWHTCPQSGPINASNPCSEYMFLDNSACNLASLNLGKFQDKETGEFDVDAFRYAVRIALLAQEILVDNARYPTEKIAENSHTYRPLGLGYANLGALLMSRGLPYDSDAGRAFAAGVTALMHGEANRMSALLAADRGPFEGYSRNAGPMLAVMERHRRALEKIDAAYVPYELIDTTRQVWDEVVELGKKHGFRNAQVTVLAPTGTIGFMMDCDTTGVEPDIALVKFKKLVGGGELKMVNNTVPEALRHLGYDKTTAKQILKHIDEYGTIEGAPHLQEEHLPVFDCAFQSQRGKRSISYMGHIKMMAAVQPFISGAISKTVNLPHDATIEDIEKVFIQSWRSGLKAIALYRDGCKRTQPLRTKSQDEEVSSEENTVKGPPPAVRHKLPAERRSITHKFDVGGNQGYLTVGMYEDGRPGEIFIMMAKQGSTISGLMDSFATAISLALQHGVPLKLVVDKFSHTRFEPAGFTDNPKIGFAKSIMDYIFRWLDLKFPNGRYAEQQNLPGIPVEVVDNSSDGPKETKQQEMEFVAETDAPACYECGTMMLRSGACHKCPNCGATSGCS
ncbi:MAG: vitamin B12-dependent ribonucleotide reductase [Pseudomonadota bacterium]